jgi:hypothetical protein
MTPCFILITRQVLSTWTGGGDSLTNGVQIDYWASQRSSVAGALYLLCRTLSLVAGCVRIPSKWSITSSCPQYIHDTMCSCFHPYHGEGQQNGESVSELYFFILEFVQECTVIDQLDLCELYSGCDVVCLPKPCV